MPPPLADAVTKPCSGHHWRSKLEAFEHPALSELALLLAWHGQHCNQRAMQPLHVTWSYARRGIFEPFNLPCFECYVEMLYTVFSEVNMLFRPHRLRRVNRRNLIFSVISCHGGRNCTNQATPHLAQSTLLNRWSVEIVAVISIWILVS